MTTQNNLDEGFFFADKATKNLYDSDKDKLEAAVQQFLNDYKDHNPKLVKKIQRNGSGRFVAVIQYNKDSKENDKSVMGKIGNKVVDKAKEVGKKVVTKVVDEVNMAVAKGKLEASSQRSLQRKKSEFLGKNPNFFFGKDENPSDGVWLAKYYLKTKANQKPAPTDRISNIKKQLSKLSDDKLKKIEDYISSS